MKITTGKVRDRTRLRTVTFKGPSPEQVELVFSTLHHDGSEIALIELIELITKIFNIAGFAPLPSLWLWYWYTSVRCVRVFDPSRYASCQ